MHCQHICQSPTGPTDVLSYTHCCSVLFGLGRRCQHAGETKKDGSMGDRERMVRYAYPELTELVPAVQSGLFDTTSVLLLLVV